MLNTTGTVLINLIIWRLPGEKADQIVIWALGVTAGILFCVALFNAYALLISGPMPTRWINAIWRIIRLVAFSWHHFKWTNRHYVPSEGAVVLASNHTAGIDPFLIQVAIPRRIRYMMTTSYRFAILKVMWYAADPIMVEQDGKDMTAVRQVIRALKKDDIIGIFPEGGLQRERRELQAFSKGIGLIARKSQAAIVPVWIYGTTRTKWMIWHFLKPSRSGVIYGKPFYADPKMSNEEVTEDIRRRMLELAKIAEQQ